MLTSHWCALTVAVVTALGTSEGRAEPSPLAWPQDAAAYRAGEALYVAERAHKFFWPTLDPERIPLLVFEPGEWAVLVNHPAPPTGFSASRPLARYRSSDDLETGDLDPNRPGWSVSVGGAAVSQGLRPGTATMGGIPVAVVRWNEVSIPPRHGGVPIAEAAICRMVGAMWLAHLESLEPRGTPSPWSYQADSNDLALIAVEHRLLAKMLRINVTEKTMDRFKSLFSKWLATRHARLAARPREVSQEEEIERREGLAEFSETVIFRLLPDLGGEQRPDLERVDPFYDRYKGFLVHRVNILNHPLVWYPGDPVEALASAPSRGASLAYGVGMIAPKWNLEFLGPSGPRKTLRGVAEAALGVDPNSEAGLLAEAKSEEGYEGLEPTLSKQLEAAEAAARRLSPVTGTRRATIHLGALDSFRASLDDLRWLGSGRIGSAGPVTVGFPGGELEADGPGLVIESAGGAQGGSAVLLSGMLDDAGWVSVDGRPVKPPAPGKAPKVLAGRVGLTSRSLRLNADSAEVSVSSDTIEVRPRPAGGSGKAAGGLNGGTAP